VTHPTCLIKRSLLLASLCLAAVQANAADITDYDKTAKSVSKNLVEQLGGKLKQEMQSGGPVKAIEVCKQAAPAIARDLSIEHGWKITRVSSKVRNPLLGTPDAWEHWQLASFDARKASGEDIKTMFTSEITEESGKQYYRFIKPMPTAEICLACHGDDKTVPPAVQARLKQDYPNDQARGYSKGDIRGAISIKRPLD